MYKKKKNVLMMFQSFYYQIGTNSKIQYERPMKWQTLLIFNILDVKPENKITGRTRNKPVWFFLFE